jgi:phosphatidylglycerophosphate synthase
LGQVSDGQRSESLTPCALARHGHINPNILTVIGVALNVGCGLLFGLGWFFWAGIALIVANLLTCSTARWPVLSGRVTRFGGFLDSSLDRLSGHGGLCGPDGLLRPRHRVSFNS